MRFDVITTMPNVYDSFKDTGIVGRAFRSEIAQINIWDLRNYATDTFKHIDDVPFGGGSGMIIKPDPIFKAFDEIETVSVEKPHRIFFTPQGKPLKQATVQRLMNYKHIVLLAGRYKGIDERVREHLIDEEISIGDYVLSGGDLPAMVLMDAIIRRLPGAVSDDESTDTDTFPVGLLDAPHYTRPAEYRGFSVPPILVSGHHKKIEEWKLNKRLSRTKEKRPDLYEEYLIQLEENKNG